MKVLLAISISVICELAVSSSFELGSAPASGEENNGFGVTVSGIGVNERGGIISGFYRLSNLSMPGRSFDARCTILFSGGKEYAYRLKLSTHIKTCSREIDISEDEISMQVYRRGDWKAISAIKSKKAFFHSEPSDGMAKKSYLAAHDIAYIYDERPEWWYVRYQAGKK